MAPSVHIRRAGPPAAFTLVELLVASTIALVVMGAVASLFGSFSRAGTNSQSVVDMSNRMRSAANRLRQDLAGLTAPVAPPLSPEGDLGYFELIEGPWTDAVDGSGAFITGSSSTSILADTDDALLFTTRSLGPPFQGNYNNSTQLESKTAEVAWFCRPSTTQLVSGLNLQTLYRKQLLVVGYVGAPPFFIAGSGTLNQISGSIPAAYSTYDISLRIDTAAGALIPNTLGDLSRRENRFFHDVVSGTSWFRAFPDLRSGTTWLTFDGTTREGEDVVLTNVIGFDVRVFDPEAIPRLNGNTVVYPNEQTYVSGSASGFTGCFVDLGCSNTAGAALTANGNVKSKLQKTATNPTATYDTWSNYADLERNGLDEIGRAHV